MRISHRYRFIFFSNPKTGSETVRRVLDPYSDIEGIPFWELTEEHPFYTHIRPVEVRALFRERGWDFEGYFKFTFVRNPWARLVSLYQMIYGGGGQDGVLGTLRSVAREIRGAHPSRRGFRRWLRTVHPNGPGAGGPPDQRWRVYGTYSIRRYAGDSEGRLLVDRIIRLEDIRTDLPAVLERLGLEEAAARGIPRINTRRYASYESFYDEPATERVRSLYREEIERFDYEFGG